jgi:hypothetical protein
VESAEIGYCDKHIDQNKQSLMPWTLGAGLSASLSEVYKCLPKEAGNIRVSMFDNMSITEGRSLKKSPVQMHRRRKVKKNKGADRRGVMGASSAVLQEAQDIFGGVDELLQQYMNRERGGDDEDQEVWNQCPRGQVRRFRVENGGNSVPSCMRGELGRSFFPIWTILCPICPRESALVKTLLAETVDRRKWAGST